MTDQDRDIIDFERANSWWKYAGSKEAAIRDRFDMTPTRYYQRLVRLLELPAAEEYDAFTVRRLRAVSQRRRAA